MVTKQIPKRTDTAFGKKVYLLGIDEDKQYVWMESAQWDCDWYWGCGYIERYNIRRGKNPHLSSDIRSHSHYSGITGKHEKYDFDKKGWILSSDYIHTINDKRSGFVATTLSDKEAWELSELMSTIYTLKQSAEIFGRGGSHCTTIENEREIVTRKEWTEEINKKILPALFEEVDRLLSPEVD